MRTHDNEPTLMGTDNPQTRDSLCVHIFSVSATMIGVCLTVLGLLRVFVNFSGIATIADDTVAITSFAFLFSCLFSYWGLHSHDHKRLRRIEKIADTCFMAGLFGMVIACCLVTYGMIPEKHPNKAISGDQASVSGHTPTRKEQKL